MSVRLLIMCGDFPEPGPVERRVFEPDAVVVIRAGRAGEASAYKTEYGIARQRIVVLDEYVPTVATLLEESRRNPTEFLCSGPLSSDEDLQKIEEHVEFLARHFPRNMPLSQAIRRAPAIAGLVVCHPRIQGVLKQAFADLLADLGIGPSNPIETYIISRLDVGTGSGTHRAVATMLADHVARHYANTSLTLDFVQVAAEGSGEYSNGLLKIFFTIAADAMFSLRLPQAYPHVTTYWIYANISTLASNEKTIDRETDVGLANVLLWPKARQKLHELSIQGSGLPFLFVRLTRLGGQLDEETLYREALRQLEVQLHSFIMPNYEDLTHSVHEAEFSAERIVEWEERVEEIDRLTDALEHGWHFPRAREYEELGSLEQVEKFVEGWKRAIEELVGDVWEGWEGPWVIKTSWETFVLPPTLEQGVPFATERWFESVEAAHQARAWAWYLLGCSLETGAPQRWQREEETRIGRLYTLAAQIHRILHGWYPLKSRRRRAEEVAPLLRTFVRLLAEVTTLLSVVRRAETFLGTELAPVRHLSKVVQRELGSVQEERGEYQRSRHRDEGGDQSAPLVLVAELSDVVLQRPRRTTWLEVLDGAVRRSSRREFQRSVLLGVKGLSLGGVQSLLGIPESNDADAVHREIMRQLRRRRGEQSKESSWWSRVWSNTAGRHSQYVAMPALSADLARRLAQLLQGSKGKQGKWRYLLGLPSLAVVHVEAVAPLGDAQDGLSALAMLIRPFVPNLRKSLSEREQATLPLAVSGVVGEPLHVSALRQAGLQETEIEMLSHFYPLRMGEELVMS